ncbi:hypothetical protein BVRB_6g146180 [Beta vulgaris subsp. vulgaris]|nr:hypothetical protein BVRB_6g146180 [Beta vulgaris subsp. vulgaris]
MAIIEEEATSGSYVEEAECLEDRQCEEARKRGRKGKRKRKVVESKGGKNRKGDAGESSKFVVTGAVLRSHDSEGGQVKLRAEVVKTQLDKCNGSHPNVNCRVETLGRIVGGFDDLKIKWVREMGFEGILHLKRKRLPRSLCYWIMSLFDPFNKVLILPGGVEYPLGKSQVYWILGIPHGPRKVPMVARSEGMKMAVKNIRERYATDVGVPLVKVIDVVEGSVCVDQEHEFKTAFLMLLLGNFLFPTTCRRLESKLVAVCIVAMDAVNYDWFSLVLDKLVEHGCHFSEKFYKDGYAKGCGGCTYFLAIIYLDRLNRRPLNWGMFPRVKAWSVQDVNLAKVEDRIASGDYGSLTCIDVAYGENHPMMPRDTMGPEYMAYEIAGLVLSGLGIELPTAAAAHARMGGGGVGAHIGGGGVGAHMGGVMKGVGVGADRGVESEEEGVRQGEPYVEEQFVRQGEEPYVEEQHEDEGVHSNSNWSVGSLVKRLNIGLSETTPMNTGRYEWGSSFRGRVELDPINVGGDNISLGGSNMDGNGNSKGGGVNVEQGSNDALSGTQSKTADVVGNVKKSRRRRCTRASVKLGSDFDVQIIPKVYPHYRLRIVKLVCNYTSSSE